MVGHRAIGGDSRKNEAGEYEFALSSEEPVERFFGMEVLDHSEEAVNMARMSDGRHPLLVNHDTDQQVGVIRKAWLDGKSRMVRVASDFSRAARAQEIKQDVEDNIRTLVSVGYLIEQVTEEKRGEDGNIQKRVMSGDDFERQMRELHGDAFYRSMESSDRKKDSDSVPTYRVTRWTPFEASIVAIPADVTVGKGRSAESSSEIREVRISKPAEKAATKERSMPEKEEGVTAVADDKPRKSPVEYERERRQAIINLCQSFNADARSEAQWIEDGTPLTEVSEKLLEMSRERGKKKNLVNSTIGLSGNETRKYSLFKAIRALRFGSVDRSVVEAAAFELDCSRVLARQLGRPETGRILIPAEVLQRPVGAEAVARAMATTPGAKGSYLVNTENMGFIDILRNRSVAMAMGARVLSGLVGNVSFARQTGKASVTWQAGEGTSVTAGDQALGQLTMSPKTAIAITDVSEQLLAQSSPSAESFIMADLARDVAIDGVDAAVINGTGGAQPLGIKNTPGVATGQDASSATYAKILAFPSTAGGANALRGNPGWVTNTAGAAKLMGVQRFSNTDTPLWEGNLMNGTLVGFNAMASEQLASANLIFGSWDEVLIGEWGVLELATDNGGTRFNAAQVGIRAMWLVDVLIRYPQAFVVSTNLS